MTKKILNENEINQAEVILAVKSVIDSLQDMAEKTAKMEANDIMPILDSVQAYFGADVAEELSTTAQGALQTVLDSFKNAKASLTQISSQMENKLTGKGMTNDMATNVGVQKDDEQADADMGGEAPAPEEKEKKVGVGKTVDQEVDDIFADSPTPAAGPRAAKESFVNTKRTKMLRESSNPDALILKSTLKLVKEGVAAKVAIKRVAEAYEIDVEDVVAIVQEATQKK